MPFPCRAGLFTAIFLSEGFPLQSLTGYYKIGKAVLNMTRHSTPVLFLLLLRQISRENYTG